MLHELIAAQLARRSVGFQGEITVHLVVVTHHRTWGSSSSSARIGMKDAWTTLTIMDGRGITIRTRDRPLARHQAGSMIGRTTAAVTLADDDR